MKKLYILVAVILVGIVGFLLAKSSVHHETTASIASQGSYIALGDSVAAGIGLTDYSDSSACDRTEQAYPNKVATTLNYTLTSVACSGATTQTGILGSQDVNKLASAPQIDTVLSSKKQPNLITMTVGANDANWTTFIAKCYSGTCGSESDTEATSAGIAIASNNITNVLNQIRGKYPANTPKVILTGYYRLFPSTPIANCPELSGVDMSERAWIAQLQNNIDSSLKAATAGYSFATFVPISFSGHELCTTDPWIQGISAKAAYHPTEPGQTAIANQITTALKNGATQ